MRTTRIAATSWLWGCSPPPRPCSPSRAIRLRRPKTTPSPTASSPATTSRRDRPPQPWEGVPPEFRAAQQRGFHDGVEGARKDFANHRPPNVNNRDEFRHPNFIPAPTAAITVTASSRATT